MRGHKAKIIWGNCALAPQDCLRCPRPPPPRYCQKYTRSARSLRIRQRFDPPVHRADQTGNSTSTCVASREDGSSGSHPTGSSCVAASQDRHRPEKCRIPRTAAPRRRRTNSDAVARKRPAERCSTAAGRKSALRYAHPIPLWEVAVAAARPACYPAPSRCPRKPAAHPGNHATRRRERSPAESLREKRKLCPVPSAQRSYVER